MEEDCIITGEIFTPLSASTLTLSDFLATCGFQPAVDVEGDGRCFFRVVRLAIICLLHTNLSWSDRVSSRPMLMGVPVTRFKSAEIPHTEVSSGDRKFIINVVNLLRGWIVTKWAEELSDPTLAASLAEKYLQDEVTWVSAELLQAVAKETKLHWLVIECTAYGADSNFDWKVTGMQLYLPEGTMSLYGGNPAAPERRCSEAAFIAAIPAAFQKADAVVIFCGKKKRLVPLMATFFWSLHHIHLPCLGGPLFDGRLFLCFSLLFLICIFPSVSFSWPFYFK